MKNRFFDFEVFPNWWCCVFGDTDETVKDITPDIKDTFVTVSSDMPMCREKLLSMMYDKDFCKLGYNIKYYDLMIANAIYQGFTPEQVYIVSEIIVNSQFTHPLYNRFAPFAHKRIRNVVYQDLFDDSDGTLKDKETVMGLDIRETTVPFGKEDLTDEDKSDILYYCKQDVYAAIKFYEIIVQPYTQTKLALARMANIPESTARSCTNAKLVSLVLKATKVEFSDAEKVTIELPEKIRDYCKRNLPPNVYNKLTTQKEGFELQMFDNRTKFGNGGIHSKFQIPERFYSNRKNFLNDNEVIGLYVESDDEYALVNVDAASYYPSIMIQFNLLSRAVSNPEIFHNIFNQRVNLKHKKDKTEWDKILVPALKLVLNTTFGASGNKWLELYDPYHCTNVCRVGQAFLGALANKINNTIESATIIQTNTDGILVYLKRSDLDKLDELQKEWSAISGINMDRDEVLKIWQRDVNNYLMVELEDGKEKIKCKGGWLNSEFIKKGYVRVSSLTAYACTKAVKDWLLYGKSIRRSILDNHNISDFCISCTKGPGFHKVVYRTYSKPDQELYKSNRVIATTDVTAGSVYKLKYRIDKYGERVEQSVVMADTPSQSKLMNNDLASYDFDEVAKTLDYTYYFDRANRLIQFKWVVMKGQQLEETFRFRAV